VAGRDEDASVIVEWRAIKSYDSDVHSSSLMVCALVRFTMISRSKFFFTFRHQHFEYTEIFRNGRSTNLRIYIYIRDYSGSDVRRIEETRIEEETEKAYRSA